MTSTSAAGAANLSGSQQIKGTSLLRTISGQALAAWRWLDQKRTQHGTARRLQVAETVSLGEKRFVSILQVDGAQYLIGGSAASVSLLAVLDKPQDFREALNRRTTLTEQA